MGWIMKCFYRWAGSSGTFSWFGLPLSLCNHHQEAWSWIRFCCSDEFVNEWQRWSSSPSPWTLLMNCRQLTAQFDFFQLKHIHREHNMVADLLAKDSVNHSEGICTLHRPPAQLKPSLMTFWGYLGLGEFFFYCCFWAFASIVPKKNLCFLLLICFS